MLFCPKCGSIMKPSKKDGKNILACSCGYKEGSEPVKITESQTKGKEIEVVDPEQDLQTLPLMDAKCEKCGNDKAYYWLVQTRAADEPETKFLKCTKCKFQWRDYS